MKRGLLVSLAVCFAMPVLAARADDAPPSYADTTLTGNWGGLRDHLRDRGVTFTLTQTGDFLASAAGGIDTGAGYDGVFEAQADFDLQRLMGWQGAQFHISGYAIQGQGISDLVGNLLIVSSVEAEPGLRLGEFYLSQDLFHDALTLKAGQILADQNFAISDTASLFVNSTFGWPGLFAEDLPGGGPAYPLAVPAVQLIVKPSDAWTFQSAIFNGSPTGPDSDGNPHGLDFPLGDGVFAIAEAAYSYTSPRAKLPGVFKIGAWYNSEDFDSLSMASNGVSLADPASSGIPAQLSGNYALYGIVDQTLWQEAGGAGDRLNGFVRVAVAPESDRSGMTWYADAGLAYKGLLPGREDDTVGVGFAYARLSPALADLAREQNAQDGTSGPIPSFESVIEVSYQAVLTQAFSVQPFFQYVINPGGNAPDPDGPDRAIPNASVFGVRLAANF